MNRKSRVCADLSHIFSEDILAMLSTFCLSKRLLLSARLCTPFLSDCRTSSRTRAAQRAATGVATDVPAMHFWRVLNPFRSSCTGHIDRRATPGALYFSPTSEPLFLVGLDWGSVELSLKCSLQERGALCLKHLLNARVWHHHTHLL
jgi:hypothetical protein